MLQYLLNTSAIWLISLVIFDIFLRKESYHSYNRFYLVFTFMLGVLLPLVQWQSTDAGYLSVGRPVEKVIAAKQNIVAAVNPASGFDWQSQLWAIYAIGLILSLVALLADSYKLLVYYRQGTRSKQNGWTIVETGKGHAPFSLLNVLFTDTRQQYDNDEWNIILTHEKRHAALLHFADLLLMQAARIVFWFHPLVYLYNKRLLLVHEFQADRVSASRPGDYGRFLVEQSILQSSPALSHSFNRSPIKKRIVMLTRTSSFAAKGKMLLFIPIALFAMLCCSKNSFSQRYIRNGNFVTYKGNRFELSRPYTDTQVITDPVTGQEFTKYITHNPTPVKMNGRPIIKETDKPPYFTGNDKNLRAYLLKNLKKELSGLDDGDYTLDVYSVLINEQGKVIYLDYAGVHSKVHNVHDDPKKDARIGKALQDNISKELYVLIDKAPAYIPAKVNGQSTVAPTADDYTFWNNFRIIGHKVYDNAGNNGYEQI